MHLELDVLVGLGLGQRLFDAVLVVVESFADLVGDFFGRAHRANVAADIQSQHAFFLEQAPQVFSASENSPALESAGRRVAVAFAGRKQDRPLGLGQHVPRMGPAPGNHRLLRQVGFHQVAPLQAGGLRIFGKHHLDVETVPHFDHRRHRRPN